MQLPDSVPVTAEAMEAIAARHGLEARSAAPIRSAGIINSVYTIGRRHVLRVPRDHPGCVAQAGAEAAAIPAARAAGVRTPALAAFDEACDILPVPYLVVERVQGVDLESLGAGSGPDEVWREVGADLVRVHSVADPPLADGPEDLGEVRVLIERCVDEGWVSILEAGWLVSWLDRLPDDPAGPVMVHGDLQMSNVLVDPASHRYVALLDWGCARRDDPTCDFRVVPMGAVPALLDGYREAGGEVTDTLETRILRRRIELILAALPRGPAPGCSWGERPVAWLADLLRFFTDPPDEGWRRCAPPPA